MKDSFRSKSILIVRTKDEARLMELVLQLDHSPLPKVRPRIWSRRYFLDWWTLAEKIKSLDDSIIFCDVEVLSTTEDEIF